MKIINKQKAPKDILLNSILQEIGEENGIEAKKLSEPVKAKATKPRKKRSWVKVFFNFLIVLFVGVLLFVLYMINTASEEIAHKQTMQKEKEHQKKPYDPMADAVVSNVKKERAKPHPNDTHIKLVPTSKKTNLSDPVKAEKKQLSEHERAKKQLMLQMKN